MIHIYESSPGTICKLYGPNLYREYKAVLLVISRVVTIQSAGKYDVACIPRLDAAFMTGIWDILVVLYESVG